MQLKGFSVSNYRSIKGAKNIALNDYTVLVGKNNEGKSNLLHALNLAIRDINNAAKVEIPRKETSMSYSESYRFHTDFPKDTKPRNLVTTVKLFFSLSDTDILDFKTEVGQQINNLLTLKVTYDSKNKVEIVTEKKGGRNWQKKIHEILIFVATRINFVYIPAIRTEDTFSRIIHKELRNAISVAAKSEEYEKLIQKVYDLEQAAVENISESVQNSLTDWLPSVEGVRISIENHTFRGVGSLYNSKLFVTSSGVETLLENKGDGVQSLFTLALLAKNSNENRNTILAIDEPESHLHPEAIHRLKNTILNLSQKSQVIVSTHNPIFVNTNNESSNVIVNSGSVRKATSIHEIRDILGVSVSDNLTNTNNAIAVEGETDKKFLNTVIKHFGKQSLKNKINSGTIEIRAMKGVKNLKATIGSFENQLMNFYIVLDNDQSAKNAINSLSSNSPILLNQYTYLPLNNCKKEFELEDFYTDKFITETCDTLFGTSLGNTVSERYLNQKWSFRMDHILTTQGVDFNGSSEKLKNRLADDFVKSSNPKSLLKEDTQKNLEVLIGKIQNFFFSNQRKK